MSTVNAIELRVNLRANNNEKSDQYGRLYAELDRNPERGGLPTESRNLKAVNEK